MHSRRILTLITKKSTIRPLTLLRRGLATSPSFRNADPTAHTLDYEPDDIAVPHGNPEETKQKYEPKSGKAEQVEQSDDQDYIKIKQPKGTEPLSPPRHPHRSSPTLDSTGAHNPADHTFHQKRYRSTALRYDQVSCTAGIDDLTWPQKEEEDKGYYLRHKASPLAEVQMADTRKPIAQVTDSMGGSRESDVVGPVLQETAEETMLRAAEMWRLIAARGDPNSPHGKVLRAMRGEYF